MERQGRRLSEWAQKRYEIICGLSRRRGLGGSHTDDSRKPADLSKQRFDKLLFFQLFL